jgi:hypothetical protein
MNPTQAPNRTTSPSTTAPASSEVSGFSNVMNALGKSNPINSKRNIIAGPQSHWYWNHPSSVLETPEVREEQGFAIQGNIGAMMTEEANNQYSYCNPRVDGKVIPQVGGGPNCSGTFRQDIFTKTNTCGADCQVKYPESYGEKDFGFTDDLKWNLKLTNAHQLHAYENVRATAEGQGPANRFSSIDFVPRVSVDNTLNTSIMNAEPAYMQVGDWTRLQNYSNLVKIKYAN